MGGQGALHFDSGAMECAKDSSAKGAPKCNDCIGKNGDIDEGSEKGKGMDSIGKGPAKGEPKDLDSIDEGPGEGKGKGCVGKGSGKGNSKDSVDKGSEKGEGNGNIGEGPDKGKPKDSDSIGEGPDKDKPKDPDSIKEGPETGKPKDLDFSQASVSSGWSCETLQLGQSTTPQRKRKRPHLSSNSGSD